MFAATKQSNDSNNGKEIRAKTINEEMKIAASNAIATLARERVPDEVVAAMGGHI